MVAARQRKADAPFVAVEGEKDIEQHRLTGTYYVRVYEKGLGELFRSLKTKKIGEARTLARDMIEEWRGRAPGLKRKKRTIGELCELLFAELEKAAKTVDKDGRPKRRAGTFSKDRRFLHTEEIRGKKRPGLIQELFGRHYPETIDEEYWKTWVADTGNERFPKVGEIGKYLSHVLDYAYRKKYVGRKPEIVNPDTHKKKAVVYSDEQIQTFYRNAEPELRDLIVINSENPFRPLETPNLPWRMVSFERGKKGKPVVVVRLEADLVKNEESVRELQVSPNAAEVFRRRRKEQAPPSPYVFPSPKNRTKPLSKKTLNRMWHRMLRKAGLERSGFQFKWLRHTVYTRLLVDQGLPVAAVSAVGGTSMRTLSKHYLEGSASRTAFVGEAIRHNFGDEEE